MLYAHINIIVVYFDARVKIIEIYTCVKIIVVYLNALIVRDFGAARNIFKFLSDNSSAFAFVSFLFFSIAVYFILLGHLFFLHFSQSPSTI